MENSSGVPLNCSRTSVWQRAADTETSPPSICNRSNYVSAALVNLKGKAPTAFVYACLHPRASLCSRACTCLQRSVAGDDRTLQQTISKHVRNNDKTTRPHMERPLRHAASRTQTHGQEPKVCGREFCMRRHNLVAACRTVERYLERCK